MLKVLEIAMNEVGYLEKATNSQLDSKTGNAGSSNWTKYARDLDQLGDIYNGKKNGYAWCDVFVDWCFVKAYGVDLARKLLCQPKNSLGASCTASSNYYKNAGRFYTTPKVGDQIFFSFGSSPAHTGLVYQVDADNVYTIEGNTSGASGVVANGGGVCKKSYKRSYNRIYGYGRPDYTLVSASPEKPVSSTDDKLMVTFRTLKKGCAGTDVKTLQAVLITKFGISCGSYGVDGDFGSATESAVKRFQGTRDLVVDGVAGINTLSAMYK